MGPSKFRKAIGAVKDKTSIGLAKVGSSASLSDLEVAIVKATRHEEHPPDERYIREILNITTYSRAFVSSCVTTISRRLSKTKNWVVALKALMLVQRLLAEGDAAYEQEIFFATRRGTRLLNMSDFRDTSGKSNAWDYSAFVRTYALYLDEQLEFRMQSRRGKHSGYGYQTEEEEGGGGRGGAATSNALVVRGTPHFHLLNSISFSSVQVLQGITGWCVWLSDMNKVHDIFSRVSKQYDELDLFYSWCKSVGIARSSEYPFKKRLRQSMMNRI